MIPDSPYVPKVLSILAENMRRSNNPLGISGDRLSSWSRGLDLPGKAETLLYTGCEYQLLPYLPSLVNQIKRMGPFAYEGSSLLRMAVGLRKLGFDAASAFASLNAKEEDYYNDVTRRYAGVLKRHGLQFGYLGADEPYSGALLYEYGLMEEFGEHAKKVVDLFRDRNIRRIIVTSPHALEAFRVLYPQFVTGFDIETLHFTEALLGAGQAPPMRLNEPLEVTLHDPCHLARTLDMSEQPRQVLLRVKNLSLKEVPQTNKRWTTCCGAPIETLLPILSESVATRRVEELISSGARTALTLCAFCHANLRKAASRANLRVMDFAELLDRSLGGKA